MIRSNHDELMSNFLAQSDALALGKTAEEEREALVPHKVFSGNRPSSLVLFEGALDAFKTGQILSLFEHRTVVQGFVWNIGSFDQWGMELGKKLGKTIRSQIDAFRADESEEEKAKYFEQFNPSTQSVLKEYCEKSQ